LFTTIHETVKKRYTFHMEKSYDYDDMSLGQLADLRAWQLERLERVSQALRARVRAEYTEGDNIKQLAKKLGVTRATVYAWLAE
jgi:hypothetical protein